MRFNSVSLAERKRRRKEPHRWFAWYLVRVDSTTKVWLTTVMRRDVAVGLDETIWAYKEIE